MIICVFRLLIRKPGVIDVLPPISPIEGVTDRIVRADFGSFSIVWVRVRWYPTGYSRCWCPSSYNFINHHQNNNFYQDKNLNLLTHKSNFTSIFHGLSSLSPSYPPHWFSPFFVEDYLSLSIWINYTYSIICINRYSSPLLSRNRRR